MIKFTVYPDDGPDHVQASFKDLGTTAEIWETLSGPQKERLILNYMEKIRPISWKIDTYDDKTT